MKPILELLGKHDLHAMAHITGGGLTENIIRVIPDGLGLDIEASAIVLPPVFDWLQREGAVPREEMWRTFNCGVGFVLVRRAGRCRRGVAPTCDRLGLAHRAIGRWWRRAATNACASAERRCAMRRLAVLASGRGSNLQALLDAIAAGTLDARDRRRVFRSPRCACAANA